MYITEEIANRIKLQAKSKNVTIKDILSHCEMNINAISNFSKGKVLSCISLAKIADYLDCSVDYLLGRTDNVGTAPSPLISAYNNASDEIKAAVRKLLDMDK